MPEHQIRGARLMIGDGQEPETFVDVTEIETVQMDHVIPSFIGSGKLSFASRYRVARWLGHSRLASLVVAWRQR